MRVLEKFPRENGRDYALRVIKENIIHLDLEPGSQISETELAAELGLSRTPVREALIELAIVQIVDIQPQKKSVVRLIDYGLMEESVFMRKVLEHATLDIVCEIAKPEDLERLRENICLQRFYLEHRDCSRLQALDDEFHRMLFGIGRKLQVYTQMKSISIHFDRVRSMSLMSVKDIKIVQDHENLTEAISRKDVTRAHELLDRHLNRYKIDAEAIRKKYPQYFKKDRL